MRYHDHRDSRIIYLVSSSPNGRDLYGTLRWYLKTDTDFWVMKQDVALIHAQARQKCFPDVYTLRVAAREMFFKRFDVETHILVASLMGDLDPSEVLCGPEPWRTEINKIVKEFEDGDCWDRNVNRAHAIAGRYETKMMEIIPMKNLG